MCLKGTGGDVDETVRAQLKNAMMGSFRGAEARRADVELEHSFNSVVPAMAAWAGLGNGPRMLYRFPGFYRLHVSYVEGGGSASGMIEVGHAW